jgi:hypothetical protein
MILNINKFHNPWDVLKYLKSNEMNSINQVSLENKINIDAENIEYNKEDSNSTFLSVQSDQLLDDPVHTIDNNSLDSLSILSKSDNSSYERKSPNEVENINDKYNNNNNRNNINNNNIVDNDDDNHNNNNNNNIDDNDDNNHNNNNNNDDVIMINENIRDNNNNNYIINNENINADNNINNNNNNDGFSIINQINISDNNFINLSQLSVWSDWSYHPTNPIVEYNNKKEVRDPHYKFLPISIYKILPLKHCKILDDQNYLQSSQCSSFNFDDTEPNHKIKETARYFQNITQIRVCNAKRKLNECRISGNTINSLQV